MPSAAPSADFLTALLEHARRSCVVIVGFLAFNLVLWWVIRPSRYSEEKLTTYECGENPTGSRLDPVQHPLLRLRPHLRRVRRGGGLPAALGGGVQASWGCWPSLEGLVFIAILVVALAYVWRKGDLEWVRAEDRS